MAFEAVLNNSSSTKMSLPTKLYQCLKFVATLQEGFQVMGDRIPHE